MKHRTPDAERENDTVSPQQRGTERSQSSDGSGTVESLHRAVGNRAVQRMHEGASAGTKPDVSRPGDADEVDATRIAAQVMDDSQGPTDLSPASSTRRRAPDDQRPVVGRDAGWPLDSFSGGGRPLPSSVRSFFEPRFGREFGDVRLHTGTDADEAASSLHAEAFTLGKDIAFAAGNFRPATSSGRALIAHELAHVVQQRSAGRSTRIHRQAVTASGRGTRWSPSDGSDRTTTYLVGPGDTLWDIAERQYGDGRLWPAIYRANRDRIDDPDRIYPGQELTIPPQSEAEASARTSASGSQATGKVPESETMTFTEEEAETPPTGETMTFTEEEASSIISSEGGARDTTEQTAPKDTLGTKGTGENAKMGSGGWLDSSLQWVWGVLEGDFKEDPSISQIIVRTVLTLIPYVDQVADVQDLTAALYKLVWQERTDEFGPWFDLVLTAVGFIPEAGSLIKGGTKLVRKGEDGASLLRRLSAITGGASKPTKRLVDFFEDNRKVIKQNAAGVLRDFATRADNVAVQLENVPWWVPDAGRIGDLAEELRRLATNSRQLADEAPRKVDEVLDQVLVEIQGTKRQIAKGAAEVAGEMPVITRFDDSVKGSLKRYWAKRIDLAEEASKKETYRKYIRRIDNGDRPTPTQAEEEIGYLYRSIGKGEREVSYIHGRRTYRGKSGSTRPDVVDQSVMVEVKRVKPGNKSSLHGKLKTQIPKRATEGPAGAKQTVVVDVRGLNVSREQMQKTAKEIVSDVNASLSAEGMENLRKLSITDIQFVTW